MKDWLIGAKGGAKAPCRMRKKTKLSRSVASPQSKVETVNITTAPSNTVRREKRPASQPLTGVATAVAIMLKVTTKAISSVVADSAP